VSNKHTGGSNSLLISGMPIAHAWLKFYAVCLLEKTIWLAAATGQ
jgi:hypothetical protein